MLLTNSNQITMPKVEQPSTLQCMLSDMQLTDDGVNEFSKPEGHTLVVESELQRRVREMEDAMFHESVQVYHLLNSPDAQLVDGLTYRQIQQSESLSCTLKMITGNAPIYQHLNRRQRYTLINSINHKYLQKLTKGRQMECQKQADLPKNQSQNQYGTTNNSLNQTYHQNNNLKTKPLHKSTKPPKNDQSSKPTKKKVRISSLSFCKYFCSRQAARKIRRNQINSMQTF